MSYDPSTRVISRAVSIDNINNCLGAGSLDLGTLCVSSLVNMWAKYKPTRYNTLVETGRSTSSQWWKASDGSCGIHIPAIYQFPDLFNLDWHWTYEHPRGLSSNEAYRALDFDGYKHGSSAVDRNNNLTGYMVEEDVSSLIVPQGGKPTFHLQINPKSSDPLLLSRDEIYVGYNLSQKVVSVADMYPGVVLVPEESEYMSAAFKFSDRTLGQILNASPSGMIETIIFDDDIYPYNVAWYVMPCLYAFVYGYGSIYASFNRPQTRMSISKATNYLSAIIVSAYRTNPRTATFTITIVNGYAESKSVTVEAILAHALRKEEWDPGIPSKVSGGTTRTYTVSALSSETYTISFDSSVDFSASGPYWAMQIMATSGGSSVMVEGGEEVEI